MCIPSLLLHISSIRISVLRDKINLATRTNQFFFVTGFNSDDESINIFASSCDDCIDGVLYPKNFGCFNNSKQNQIKQVYVTSALSWIERIID